MKKAYNWRDLSLLLSHYMHHWVCRKAWALPLLRSSLIITYKGCAVMGSRYSTLLIWQPEKTILLIPKLDPSFQHHKNELKRGRKKKKKVVWRAELIKTCFLPGFASHMLHFLTYSFFLQSLWNLFLLQSSMPAVALHPTLYHVIVVPVYVHHVSD